MKFNKLYQGSFHNLNFRDVEGLKLTLDSLPNSDFYEKLYKELKRREIKISQDFIESKTKNAELIYEVLRKKTTISPSLSILSWAAGIGIVESYIYDKCKVNIDAVETIKDDKFWNEKVGYYKSLEEITDKKYDVFLVVSALYSMTDKDLQDFVQSIKKYLNDDGIIIIHEQAPLPILTNINIIIKNLIKKLINKVNITLWGFLRSPNEYQIVFNRGGYMLDEIKFYDSNVSTPFIEIGYKSLKQPFLNRKYKSMILTFRNKNENN